MLYWGIKKSAEIVSELIWFNKPKFLISSGPSSGITGRRSTSINWVQVDPLPLYAAECFDPFFKL